MIWGSGGSKNRLAKGAGAGPSGQIRDEKVHAVVAGSTFQSQNVQSTTGSEHFWKLGSRKSARRCDAKHISKSKVLKTDIPGPLLDVLMPDRQTDKQMIDRQLQLQLQLLYRYNNYSTLMIVHYTNYTSAITTTTTTITTTATATTTLHDTTRHYATLHCTTLE